MIESSENKNSRIANVVDSWQSNLSKEIIFICCKY